ncbi:tetratricopeptide repeat protein [Singulisphaera acidiphila]|uniref:Tetratricopeptide repeat protein n=1 Tax=Singulisphaera acidiphila (strain ATCC BAA-1392 / DSM 18658 / VKM B-2454 / MOB10) TaxID=886293 RepID=L0DMX8_SINAD|nr:hypothetical protein Sinac_5905 [Singulisphaera acidiphila DSM 18658]
MRGTRERRTSLRIVQGVVVLAILALVSAVNGDDEDKKISDEAPAKKASSVERIPDPSYEPKRGDHAMVYGYYEETDRLYRVYGAKYNFVYRDYWKALEIKDSVGVDELRMGKNMEWIPQKTGVLVLEIEEHEAEDPRPDAAVVRIMDGPLKDQKLWVARFNVARLIENPNYVPPKPEREAKPAKTDKKAKEAAQQLNAAESYRQGKKYDSAKVWYERVIRDFADYPEAETARERLKTLPKK